MARILTVSAEEAEGPRRDIIANLRNQYGVLPGVFKILLTDLE